MLTIFLHRLLQSFLLPPFNSLIIIILGSLFCKSSAKKSRLIILIGCFSLYLQSTPYFAYYLTTLIASSPMKIAKLKQAQALVILGGGVNTSVKEYSVNSMSNSDTFIRIRYGAYLAKQAPQLPIFLSGGAVDSRNSEASLMKKSLRQEFNINNPIYLEPDSKTTAENAKFTARLLLQYRINHIVLVTSAIHMQRAMALFAQNGINVIAAPTGFYSLGYENLPILWFIPSASAMLNTSSILHEIIGYLYDVNLD